MNNFNVYYDKVSQTAQDLISGVDFDRIQISDEIKSIISNSTDQIINTISDLVKNGLTKFLAILTSLPTVGLYIVITILALYFICTDKIYMLDQIEHHLPEKWVKNLSKHVRELIKSLGCYLKAQLILIGITFLISVIGLYIFSVIGLNVNYPLMVAVRNCFS